MSLPRPVHPAPPRPEGGAPLGPDRSDAPGSAGARADSFAFWGHDRAALGRPPGISRLDRLRGDARVGAVALLAAALVAGFVWYRIGVDGSDEPVGASTPRATAEARPASASTAREAEQAGSELVVHVAGVVVRPGIVRLRAGSRVADAIEAAGGARPEADLDQLNLAAKIIDGQRIAVALPGQVAVPGDAASASTPSGASVGSTEGPLNLNTATQADVEELPGIGPVLGAAILRERDERGGFRSVDELRSVRGIGEKRFADLHDLVTV